MQPGQDGPIGDRRITDHDGQMFDAAVARAKRDDARVLGVGERHARITGARERRCDQGRIGGDVAGVDEQEGLSARPARQLVGFVEVDQRDQRRR